MCRTGGPAPVIAGPPEIGWVNEPLGFADPCTVSVNSPADPGTIKRRCTHSGPERAQLGKDEPSQTGSNFAAVCHPDSRSGHSSGWRSRRSPPHTDFVRGGGDHRTTPWLPPVQPSSALLFVCFDAQPVGAGHDVPPPQSPVGLPTDRAPGRAARRSRGKKMHHMAL